MFGLHSFDLLFKKPDLLPHFILTVAPMRKVAALSDFMDDSSWLFQFVRQLFDQVILGEDLLLWVSVPHVILMFFAHADALCQSLILRLEYLHVALRSFKFVISHGKLSIALEFDSFDLFLELCDLESILIWLLLMLKALKLDCLFVLSHGLLSQDLILLQSLKHFLSVQTALLSVIWRACSHYEVVAISWSISEQLLW